ncbi:unnamed protein product, partial [Phaeothamnion confervicola]
GNEADALSSRFSALEIEQNRPRAMSLLMKRTIEWMRRQEEPPRVSPAAAATAAVAVTQDVVRGGILCHLSHDAAFECLSELLSKGFSGGERAAAGVTSKGSGGDGRLPRGGTLVVCPKKALEEWSSKVRDLALDGGDTGRGGPQQKRLTVRIYTSAARNRRRVTAEQLCAADVVLTTPEVLKAKECPITPPKPVWAQRPSLLHQQRQQAEGSDTAAAAAMNPAIAAAAAAAMPALVSLPHKVAWGRVVIDRAQLLR